MGLFSHFNPVKAITRAVGVPDKISRPIQIAFAPFTAPTSIGIGLGQKLLRSAFPASPGVSQIHDQAAQGPQYGNVPQPIGPSYTYYAGGGGYSPFQGGPTGWDYSTPLTTFSQPPLVTYPRYSPATSQPGDRIWEDLILGSSLFL